MKYRIITALLLVAVLVGLYLLFGDGGTSGISASRPGQSQSAPAGGNPLRDFKIP